MGIEVHGEIREPLSGPVGGVRILRRGEGLSIELEIITHSGEFIKGRYSPPLSSGSCIQEIDLPGRIPDTGTINQRYRWILGPHFSDSLIRDQGTLRLMEYVPISSNGNGNGSERWVTRVRRSVLYPAGLFNGSSSVI